MLKKLAIATLAVLFLAPSLILVGIGVVMNPALTATGACVVPGGTNLTCLLYTSDAADDVYQV